MKKRILIPLAFVFVLATSYSDTTVFRGTQNGTTGTIFVNNGVYDDLRWSNGLPDATKDVVINYGYWSRALGNSVVEMNSLTMDVNMSFLTLSGTDEGNVRGGTYVQSDYVGPTLKIGNGGLTLNNDGGEMTFGSASYRYGMKNVSIGGDITFNKVAILVFSWDPNETYSTSNWSLDVGGVVKMNNNSLTQRFTINRNGGGNQGPSPTASVYAYARLGGLDGMGVVCNHYSGALGTTFYFQAQDGKTFQGGDFQGTFSKWQGSNVGMKIVMDGGANGEKQTLRLGMQTGDAQDQRPNTFELEVLSGKMAVYNDTASKFDSVKISDGSLEVTTATKDASGFGGIVADSLQLDGGSLIFNAGKTDSDYIQLSSISGLSTDIIIALNNDFNVGDDLAGLELDLFRGIDADLNALDVKVYYNDIEQIFAGAFNDGTFIFTSGTVVPEPAAVAALFGALALVFAVYRRRR